MSLFNRQPLCRTARATLGMLNIKVHIQEQCLLQKQICWLIFEADILIVSTITTSGCVNFFNGRKFGGPKIRCFVMNFLSHFYTLVV